MSAYVFPRKYGALLRCMCCICANVVYVFPFYVSTILWIHRRLNQCQYWTYMQRSAFYFFWLVLLTINFFCQSKWYFLCLLWICTPQHPTHSAGNTIWMVSLFLKFSHYRQPGACLLCRQWTVSPGWPNLAFLPSQLKYDVFLDLCAYCVSMRN